MHLPSLSLQSRLIGVDDAALLAAMPIALRLQELERAPRLGVLQSGPLLAPLTQWLGANQYPHESIDIALADADAWEYEPFVLAASASILIAPRERELAVWAKMGPESRLLIVAPGSEAGLGHDADACGARLAELSAAGAVIDVSYLAPLGPQGRGYMELIEHVHHGVGPGLQAVVFDALRAALLGKSGDIAVNLAARAQPPRISWATATYVWIDPVAARSA